MKLFKNKKFYTSILIDFSFLVVLYFFLLFIVKKIQGYALKLQEFGLNLKQTESVLQQNVSLLDYDLLLGNMELMNQIIQKVLILFFLLLVGSFLMYILFQGIQWSFILDNFKNLKKYFWKFSLVSFVSFSLSLLFSYYILLNVRTMFINYLTGISFYSFIIKVVLLIILILVLWYYTSICYVLLNKYKLIEALKKTFLFNNLKSVFVYLICFVLIVLVLFLFARFGLFLMVGFILILFVVNYFRYYLVGIK